MAKFGRQFLNAISYLPSAPVTVEYGVKEGVAIGPAYFNVCEFVLLRMDFWGRLLKYALC